MPSAHASRPAGGGLCPTCGEGTERRAYPSGAALYVAGAAAALLIIFVVGVAVGAAVFSPWIGVGPALAMAGVPSAMSASKRAVLELFSVRDCAFI